MCNALHVDIHTAIWTKTHQASLHTNIKFACASMYVQCSTLNGKLVTVTIHTSMTAKSMREQCMLCEAWRCGAPIHMISLLAINVNFADIAKPGGCIRVSTLENPLLQDGEVITEEHKLLKFVFMKRCCELGIYNRIAQVFDQGVCEAMMTKTDPYGNRFVIHPVLGCGVLHNDIICILFQHQSTQDMCDLKKKFGLDPADVSSDAPICVADFHDDCQTVHSKVRSIALPQQH